jgi:hypothetical protein
MPLGGLTLSELIGALSHALDITEGQARALRALLLDRHARGARDGPPDETLWELYYTLLLKDLGCSSNAARICELYLTDDLSFKHDFKTVNGSLPKVLKFVIGHTGLGAGLTERFKAIAHIVQHGDEIAQELIQTRCTRGADIARQLRFGDGVAAGIHSLDEHWNGGGRPERLKGEAIPVLSRIALLAQVVDVFNVSDGADAACWEVEDRCGSWFDPAVVSAFRRCAADPAFWEHCRPRSGGGGVRPGAGALRGAAGRGLPRRDRDCLRAGGGRQEPLHGRAQRPGGAYTDGIAAELGLDLPGGAG